MKLTLFGLLGLLIGLSSLLLMEQGCEAYHKKHHDHGGQVKIKVWRGPSQGYKKHKYAPFGYHFSVDDQGHY